MAKKETKNTEVEISDVVQDFENTEHFEVAPEVVSEQKETFTREDMERFAESILSKAGLGETKKAVSAFDDKEKEVHIKINRFDGKFVVDYKDRNIDKYSDQTVFVFNQKNIETGAIEPHIELVFIDGSSEIVPYRAYFRNRKRDIEFKALEIKANKKVVGDGRTVTRKEHDGKFSMIDTGNEVALEYVKYSYKYVVDIEGQTYELPDYVIA